MEVNWLRKLLHRCQFEYDVNPFMPPEMYLWRCPECGTVWFWQTCWIPDLVGDLAGTIDIGHEETGWFKA